MTVPSSSSLSVLSGADSNGAGSGSKGSNGGSTGSTGKGGSSSLQSSTDSDSTIHIRLSRSNVDARILDARLHLPIYVAREAIADAVRENDTVVILGETGSGKTTQIPQYLFEGGLAGPLESKPIALKKNGPRLRKNAKAQMIGITQPRRVAAISLAKRVAVEMGVPEPGLDVDELRTPSRQLDGNMSKKLVGYSVRFDDRTTRDTRIKFMTDGWLLRELLSGQESTKVKAKRRDETRDKETLRSTLGKEQSQKRAHSLLEKYSVIVIDEAHERSVHTDVVLGLVKRVQRERKRRRMSWIKRLKDGQLGDEELDNEPSELKIVVMSATIDADKFARFFATPRGNPAPVLYIKGRQYPIKLYHSEQPCSDWLESCKKLLVMLNEQPPGDVLIFMTGAEEIESFAADLIELNNGLRLFAEEKGKHPPLDLVVVKLYAALGGEAIRKCFAPTPPRSRKIVLATNIAETSITISGIKFVIDCGLVKERAFQNSMMEGQSSGNGGGAGQAGLGASLEMLTVKPISKAAARQRSGRAGRESHGVCYRLYSEEAFETLEESTQPEILRTDLSSVVLDVFAMGLDPLNFEWLDRPDDEGMMAAVLNLTQLGALEMAPSNSTSAEQQKHALAMRSNPVSQLTDLGQEMAKLPLLPALSKTLLTARDYDGGDEDPAVVFVQALDLVSVLSTERRSILVEPAGRSGTDGYADGSSKNDKRQEADRAREQFAHRSGDHATQLQALAAFHEAQEQCKHNQDLSNGSNAKALDSKRLKDWCNTHYVSLKAVREAMRIRSQLVEICKRNDWLPSGTGLDSRHEGIASLHEADSSDESDEELQVVRGSLNGDNHVARQTVAQPHTSDFAALRRCLVQGKRLNTAFRDGQSAYYTRAHGGSTRFRIHPSSSLLLASQNAATGVHSNAHLPLVIYFDDMIFTSQLFARSVSSAEASWLAEMNNFAMRTRSTRRTEAQD